MHILRRWDVASGKLLYLDAAPLGHTAPARRLIFRPDCKRLVSVGEDESARVCDVPGAKPLRTIALDSGPIDAWTLTPDGSVLIGVDRGLTVQRWPLTGTGPPQRQLLRALSDLNFRLEPFQVGVAPDGNILAVCT